MLESLAVQELPAEFEKWTRRPLAQCYDLFTASGDINANLFQRYPEHFELTLDLAPLLKLKPESLRTGKYPITFPKEYFQKELEKMAIPNENSTNSSTPMFESESIIIDDD